MDLLVLLTAMAFVPGGRGAGLDAFGQGSVPAVHEPSQSDSCARAGDRISFGIRAEHERRVDYGSLLDALLSVPPWLGDFVDGVPVPEGTRFRFRIAPRSFLLGCTLELSI